MRWRCLINSWLYESVAKGWGQGWRHWVRIYHHRGRGWSLGCGWDFPGELWGLKNRRAEDQPPTFRGWVEEEWETTSLPSETLAGAVKHESGPSSPAAAWGPSHQPQFSPEWTCITNLKATLRNPHQIAYLWQRPRDDGHQRLILGLGVLPTSTSLPISYPAPQAGNS